MKSKKTYEKPKIDVHGNLSEITNGPALDGDPEGGTYQS